jgi:uncharacterized protein
MDRYAGSMIARGPTMTENGASQTGSMHMVNLPALEAARVFAYEEPYYKLGVYRDVFMRRWHNALGRTMWEFEGDELNNRRSRHRAREARHERQPRQITGCPPGLLR